MSERDDLSRVVRKAVALIVQTQNEEGGWRYFPVPKDADLSVTACQLMALRAARNTGISVPKETIDKGIEYIQRCQNPDGGFRYRINDSMESRFARSAAAVTALYTSGIHEGPVLDKGRAYLRQNLPACGDSRARFLLLCPVLRSPGRVARWRRLLGQLVPRDSPGAAAVPGRRRQLVRRLVWQRLQHRHGSDRVAGAEPLLPIFDR